MARLCRLDVHFADEKNGDVQVLQQQIQMAGQSGSYWSNWLNNHPDPPCLEENAKDTIGRDFIFPEEKSESF
ncbi:MAG: hypothetical protein ACREFE_06705 [Limisphaerales bacterium]